MNSQQYFIKRRSDGLWWDGEGWSKLTAKRMTAVQAGIQLAELPGGMDEGVYKLVKEKQPDEQAMQVLLKESIKSQEQDAAKVASGLVCVSCGCDNGFECIDPFIAEIDEKEVQTILCDACYQEKCDDV